MISAEWDDSNYKMGGDTMYNKHLETFICVADLGSFSKAADALYISSTAVIKQINLLEQELNLQLFDRTYRGITLTKAGRFVYGDAKYLIQYSKDSLTRAQNAMQSEEKVVRIGSSLMTPSQFIMELWPQIKEYCPNIKFNIVPFDNTPGNAQTIFFNSTIGEYYIFDDNPEFIRRCDILDDSTFDPTSLLHHYNLKPGVYNVFSFHHVSNANDRFAFDKYVPVSLAVVFTNSANKQGKVKIHRLGFSTFNEYGWGCRNKAYKDYQQTFYDAEEKILGNQGLWLSDIVGEKIINPTDSKSGTEYGIVHLLMEFEVLEEVDFAIVAYKDLNQGKRIYIEQKPTSIYEHSSSTSKGISKSSQTKIANELLYIVNDKRDSDILYINIENQFYDRRKADCFETNCNPWGHPGHFSGSSSVNLQYDGTMAVERNDSGEISESESRVWYLDSLHSKFPYECDLPGIAKFGEYTNKESFLPNERFSDEWLKSTQNSDNRTILSKEFNSDYNPQKDPDKLENPHRISKDFIEFGITHQIPIRIFNNSNKQLFFVCEIDCSRFNFFGTSLAEYPDDENNPLKTYSFNENQFDQPNKKM